MIKKLVASWALLFSSVVLACEPISLVSSYSSGGGFDAILRKTAERMSHYTGCEMIVINKPGASGVVAANFVDNHKGNRIILAVDDAHFINKFIRRESHQFTPLARVGKAPLVLVANRGLGIGSIGDFLKEVRSGESSFASAGVNSIHHLSGELISRKMKFQWNHIPYSGGSQVEVAAGHVPFSISSYQAAMPFVQSGKIDIVANLSNTPLGGQDNRMSKVIPGFDMNAHVFFLAPKSVSPEVREVVTTAFINLQDDDEFIEFKRSIEDKSPVLTGIKVDHWYKAETIKWMNFIK